MLYKIWSQLINLKTCPKRVEYLIVGVIFQFFTFISETILFMIQIHRAIIMNNYISYKKGNHIIIRLNILFYMKINITKMCARAVVIYLFFRKLFEQLVK